MAPTSFPRASAGSWNVYSRCGETRSFEVGPDSIVTVQQHTAYSMNRCLFVWLEIDHGSGRPKSVVPMPRDKAIARVHRRVG
jgi:hypothetical protein